MSKMHIESIFFTEVPVKSGKLCPAYVISGKDGKGEVKQMKIFDFTLSTNPDLKKDLIAVQKATLPATFEVVNVKVGAFYQVSRIHAEGAIEVSVMTNAAPTAAPVRVTTTTDRVSDVSRQGSIERQNALTNASNIIASMDKGSLEDLIPESIGAIVRSLAKELLKIHD